MNSGEVMPVGLVLYLLNYATDLNKIWNSTCALNVLGMA